MPCSGYEIRIDSNRAGRFLRILTLCYEFPPLGGGGGRVVHGLARELVRQGHDVTVVTMGFAKLPRREDVDGVDIRRVPGIRRRLFDCTVIEAACHVPVAALEARRLLRGEHFDLVHAHFILPDGINAWWLKRQLNRPFIVTAHGSDVPGYDPHRLRAAHRIAAPAWRAVVRSADAIVCPSRYMAGLVHAEFPSARIDIIPNGLDGEVVYPDGACEGRILAVAKMLERKGLQHLLRAVSGIPGMHEVDIVGDGPYLPELKRLAAEINAPVRFWGWLDNGSAELRHLYESASIFVLPSDSENFPIVLLEAMRAGLAIVTTSGSGCAEVVGDAGILVEPRSPEAIRAALLALMNDPDRMRRLGRAAYTRFESRFGWPAVASQYVELYARCVR